MSNPFLCQIKIRVYLLDTPVPDPDLELKRGPGHPYPLGKGGAWSPNKIFVWSKNKVGGLPGPLPWIRHCIHQGPLGVGTHVPSLNFKTHHFRY